MQKQEPQLNTTSNTNIQTSRECISWVGDSILDRDLPSVMDSPIKRSASETIRRHKPTQKKTKQKRRGIVCPSIKQREQKGKRLNIHKHFEVEQTEKQQSSTSGEQQNNNNQEDNDNKLKELKKTYSELLFKIIRNLRCHFPKVWKTLLSHLSKMGTADKYIRFLNSILKIKKAIDPQSKFMALSKQLVIARQIVQWQSKYCIIREFRNQQLSAFDVAFKAFEFCDNIFDYTSFWLGLFGKRYQLCAQLSDKLGQWSSDCYFYECCVSLVIYSWNFVADLREYRSIHVDQSCYQISKSRFDQAQQSYNELADELQEVKKQMQDSPQNNELKKLLIKIQEHIKLKETEFRLAGEDHHFMSQKRKDKARQSMVKNGLKMIKFILDGRSSYNNYSKKRIALDPLNGGMIGFVSSILSMYILWRY